MAEHVEAIFRRPRVLDASGDSRSTLYLKISQGLWTRPVRIGPRSVGWPSSEVAAINSARIAGKSDDDIRALVAQLEAARTATSHVSEHDDRGRQAHRGVVLSNLSKKSL